MSAAAEATEKAGAERKGVEWNDKQGVTTEDVSTSLLAPVGDWQIPNWVLEEARDPSNDQFAGIPKKLLETLGQVEAEHGVALDQDIVEAWCVGKGSIGMIRNVLVNPSIAKKEILDLVAKAATPGEKEEKTQVEGSTETSDPFK